MFERNHVATSKYHTSIQTNFYIDEIPFPSKILILTLPNRLASHIRRFMLERVTYIGKTKSSIYNKTEARRGEEELRGNRIGMSRTRADSGF